MNTSYIYSTSQVNTLSQYLLSHTDIERLLVAGAGNELEDALKETYLAPFLTHTDGNMPEAIEQTLIDAKKLIHRLAPKGDMFRPLWLQYDIHNLRIFAKAAAKGIGLTECLAHCSRRGIYEPEYLFTHAQDGTLNRLQSEWQTAYDEALRLVSAGDISAADAVLDDTFFTMAVRIARRAQDPFMVKYVKAVIDLFNLKARLRTFVQGGGVPKAAFVSGGNFAEGELETKEQVLAAYRSLGSASHWDGAVEFFETSGNTTRLDARSDEYLVTFAKTASIDMFSPASLVLYYLQCRQAAANVRTIFVGKNSGMNAEDIRANLRLAYVNA